jgi:hypothetical protein
VIKDARQIDVRILVTDRQANIFCWSFSCDLRDRKGVLISDSLASELKISIEDPKRGFWRLSDDPTRRNSEKPEY